VSTFRPASDSAAEALSRFPEQERLRACELIDQPIRPQQLFTILQGVSQDAAYDQVLRFQPKGRLLVDWDESVLSVLAQIDEPRAWAEIERQSSKLEWWPIRHLLRYLMPENQLQLLTIFVKRGIQDGWYFEYVIKALNDIQIPIARKLPLLTTIREQLSRRPYRSPKNKDQLMESLDTILGKQRVQ
jgi:hypothetical protein